MIFTAVGFASGERRTRISATAALCRKESIPQQDHEKNET
jgi:hypothetical protein